MKERKEKDVNRLYLIILTTQKCQTNKSSEFLQNGAISLYTFPSNEELAVFVTNEQISFQIEEFVKSL